MKKYNAYDFDHTIYNGDCTRDFYWYEVKKHPRVLLYAIPTALCAIPFALKIKSKTWFKEHFYKFLKMIDAEQEIKNFWDKNQHKIKEYYLKQKRENDIIISASPEWIVAEMCHRLELRNIIGSNVNMHSGKYTGLNCWGAEKVEILRARIPDAENEIEEFYSDSLSDTPLAELAERAFLVEVGGEKLSPWTF